MTDADHPGEDHGDGEGMPEPGAQDAVSRAKIARTSSSKFMKENSRADHEASGETAHGEADRTVQRVHRTIALR